MDRDRRQSKTHCAWTLKRLSYHQVVWLRQSLSVCRPVKKKYAPVVRHFCFEHCRTMAGWCAAVWNETMAGLCVAMWSKTPVSGRHTVEHSYCLILLPNLFIWIGSRNKPTTTYCMFLKSLLLPLNNVRPSIHNTMIGTAQGHPGKSMNKCVYVAVCITCRFARWKAHDLLH